MYLLQHDDPQIVDLVNAGELVYKYALIDIAFPWIRYIYNGFNKKISQHFGTMKSVFKTIIDSHLGTLGVEGEPKESIL